MMRLSHFLATPIICLFLGACSSPPEPNKNVVSQFNGLLPQIVDNDEGIFHGIALGMTPEEVKKNALAQDSLGEEHKDYLEFEGKLSPQKEYYYECHFDEKGLKDLTLDIHLKDMPDADSLFADFKDYFSKRYGLATESDEVHAIWLTTEGKRPAKLVVTNDAEYTYGHLTVVFFDKTLDPPANEGDSMPTGADSLLILP